MNSAIQSRRILVVDDDTQTLEVIAELLDIHGHTVRCASNGLMALELVASFMPEVVLLDLGMPDLDGYQVAAALRRQHSSAKVLVVALTGHGDYASRVRVRDSGFHMHIVKPASVETLLMAVNAVPA
jgi:DNA-binding response OmpR family regulator